MDASASLKSAGGLTTFSTANNPVEEFCSIGSPLTFELKGKRYHSQMRGAKAEFVTTNILGGKPRLTAIPETSFILADMPKNYAAAGLEYYSSLTVRFLSEGSVYAFKTMLIGVYSHPPVLVLEYPNELQRYNLRSSERVSIVSPARISSEDAGSLIQLGAVLDISGMGAFIGLETKNGLSEGGKLRLSFTFSNGVVVNQLVAVVRSIDEESGKYLMGVEFLGQDSVVTDYCRKCANYVASTPPVGSDAMLELGKEAVIEFAGKNGTAIVRGWKEGKKGYLLTEKPQGSLPPIPVGQSAIIRVTNRGTIYGMAVTYKEFLKRTNMCFFPFQDDVITHSLRGEERVQCQFLATVHPAENQPATPISCVIVNLGKGGLRFVTNASLQAEPGKILSISFHPGGIGLIGRLKMHLMRVSNHDSQFEYATKYVDMDPEHAKLLDSYFEFYRIWASCA